MYSCLGVGSTGAIFILRGSNGKVNSCQIRKSLAWMCRGEKMITYLFEEQF